MLVLSLILDDIHLWVLLAVEQLALVEVNFLFLFLVGFLLHHQPFFEFTIDIVFVTSWRIVDRAEKLFCFPSLILALSGNDLMLVPILFAHIGCRHSGYLLDMLQVYEVVLEVHLGQHLVLEAYEAESLSRLLTQIIVSQVDCLHSVVHNQLHAKLLTTHVCYLVVCKIHVGDVEDLAVEALREALCSAIANIVTR